MSASGDVGLRPDVSLSHPIRTVWVMSETPENALDDLRPLDRVARRTLTDELPPALRLAYRAVLEETMAAGVPVDPGALSVVLSTLDERSDEPLDFRAETVQELLWFAIAEFCESLGFVIPEGCHEALFAVLTILIADPRFDTSGDGAEVLFSAFRELTAA